MARKTITTNLTPYNVTSFVADKDENGNDIVRTVETTRDYGRDTGL